MNMSGARFMRPFRAESDDLSFLNKIELSGFPTGAAKIRVEDVLRARARIS
jgi:hypothetical protein